MVLGMFLVRLTFCDSERVPCMTAMLDQMTSEMDKEKRQLSPEISIAD